MIGDETNFPHKLLLTDRQVSRSRKAFANNLSGDIKLSKTQLSRIAQSGGFIGRLIGTLLKVGLLFRKNVLMPLRLTSAASATDATIEKKIYESGMIILIISNEETDIMKIVKSLVESGLLIKGVRETIESEAKEQGVDFVA